MIVIGNLDLSSFVWIGSVGARHCYGKLVWYHNGERHSKEITRIISKKEAKELNEIDGVVRIFGIHKAGEESERFDSPNDVIKKGIDIFKSNFPDGVLFKGSAATMSAKPLIYWPKKFNTVAVRINKLAEEWENIGGYEGNKKRARQIDNKFQKIHLHLENYTK